MGVNQQRCGLCSDLGGGGSKNKVMRSDAACGGPRMPADGDGSLHLRIPHQHCRPLGGSMCCDSSSGRGSTNRVAGLVQGHGELQVPRWRQQQQGQAIHRALHPLIGEPLIWR